MKENRIVEDERFVTKIVQEISNAEEYVKPINKDIKELLKVGKSSSIGTSQIITSEKLEEDLRQAIYQSQIARIETCISEMSASITRFVCIISTLKMKMANAEEKN